MGEQVIIDTWNLTLRGERDLHGISEAMDHRLGKALAIIEDELRREFGDEPSSADQ